MSNYREDYYHELLPGVGRRIESNCKPQWLKSTCPICGKEYEYLPTYKPVTCGKFTCLQQSIKQGVQMSKLKRGEMVE